MKVALEVTKRVKASHRDVKHWFCSAVPETVTDYYTIIFHPTNLALIEAQLREGAFETPEEWMASMRTVFRNAFVYNRASDETGRAVLAVAEAASSCFEREVLRLRGVVVL